MAWYDPTDWELGDVGAGALVGGAIGTIVAPGAGTAAGAAIGGSLFGAVGEEKEKKTKKAVGIAEDVAAENVAKYEGMLKDVKSWIDTRTEKGMTASEQAVSDMYAKTAPLFEQATGALSPYAKTGEKALTQWEAAMGLGPGGGDIQSMLASLPGYQFRMQQGQRATMAAASARGGIGGRALKELTRFGQGLAGEYWGDYLGELGAGIQRGQTAAMGMADIYGRQAGVIQTGQTALLQNIGNLYGTGMTTGAGAIQTSAQGITQSNMSLAEAQVAALTRPSMLENLLSNINLSVPIGGGG